MSSLKGQLLVARPELVDPNFSRTVISLLAHDDEGALGVVLNRPADSVIHAALPSGVDVGDELYIDDRVHLGGPVDPEALLVVGETVDGRAAVWGSPEPDDLPAGGKVRLYLGYAGWGAGQLELEIAEGSWVACAPMPGDHRRDDPDRLWHDVLARQALPTRLLAWYPADLSAN